MNADERKVIERALEHLAYDRVGHATDDLEALLTQGTDDPDGRGEAVELWRCPQHGLIEDRWLCWMEDDEGMGVLIYGCALCPRDKRWIEGELEGPILLAPAPTPDELGVGDTEPARGGQIVEKEPSLVSKPEPLDFSDLASENRVEKVAEWLREWEDPAMGPHPDKHYEDSARELLALLTPAHPPPDDLIRVALESLDTLGEKLHNASDPERACATAEQYIRTTTNEIRTALANQDHNSGEGS